MANRNRFPARSFPRGKQRLTQWIGPPDQNFVSVASGGASLISSVLFEEPVTLMRTRGEMSIELNSYAADLAIAGAIGAGVVSAEALAIGITAVPTPFRDADWGGWFLWRSFGKRYEFQDATGAFLASWSFEVDSKAMRKVSPNEAIVFIAESQSGAFSIFDGTRGLIKLS